MRLFWVFAVLLAGCVPDPAAKAASSVARSAFMECAYAHGAEMARQPEPAETIATAAITACSREGAAALEAYRTEIRHDATALVAYERLRVLTAEGVTGLVVRRRAGR